MAWQLIYTSAPILLEAGRSGFGTVARHRGIPGLLAGAVERVSQFSRLPGLAEHRIIYSHRHISAGGVRYHVISRICDAGADYTGRTNHLAHHLIVEAREAAAAGVSPADVMLSFAWKSCWDEAPRYLDTAEEISLGTIPRSIRLPARWWERMAGNARYAALLTAPEVSRGCYLVYACDTQHDAKQQAAVLLFGESLLLAAGRNWSIPFTTNLQPSDESGDFQWSGVWADSPVRTQAEQSERAVFHLEPGGTIRRGSDATVAVPKGPAADLAATGQSAETPKAAAIPVESLQPPPGKPSLPMAQELARMPAFPSASPAGTMPFPPMAQQSSRAKFPWVLVAMIMAGIVFLSGVGFYIAKKLQRRGELAATISKELKNVPGHKDSDPEELLRQIGNGRTLEEVQNIAATAQDLALTWAKALATTAGNRDAGVRSDVETLLAGNITQPESIPLFVKQVQGWLDLRDKVLQDKIMDEKSYDAYAALCSDPLMQNGTVDSIPVRDALLQKNADIRARFLLALLTAKPEQSIAWFSEKIDAIGKDVPEITDPSLQQNLDTLHKIITLWGALEKSLKEGQPTEALLKDQFHENPLAPAWLAQAVTDILKPRTNAIAIVAAPTPEEIHGLSTPPAGTTDEDRIKNGSKTIYIAVGDDGLAGTALLFDSRKLSKLSLVINGDASIDLEPFKSNDKIYFKKEKSWFQASVGKLEHIPPPFGDKELQPLPPYLLKGVVNEDSPGIGKEFEIRVISAGNPSAPPLLQFQGGLKIVKHDESYTITYGGEFEKLAANIVFPPDAKLKCPANFDPANNAPLLLAFSNYRADISKLMTGMADKKKELESRAAAASAPADDSSKDLAKDNGDEIKKQLQELNKSLKTDSLKKKLPSDDQPPDQILLGLKNLVATPNSELRDKARKAFEEDIQILKQAIDSIQKLGVHPEPSSNPALDAATQHQNQMELDALKKNPLLDGKLPGGSYSIVTGDATHEIILVEFIIPNTEEKNK